MTKKISELSAAAALDGTEQVEANQSGTSVRTTTQDIADLAPAGGGALSVPRLTVPFDTTGLETEGGVKLVNLTAGQVVMGWQVLPQSVMANPNNDSMYVQFGAYQDGTGADAWAAFAPNAESAAFAADDLSGVQPSSMTSDGYLSFLLQTTDFMGGASITYALTRATLSGNSVIKQIRNGSMAADVLQPCSLCMRISANDDGTFAALGDPLSEGSWDILVYVLTPTVTALP